MGARELNWLFLILLFAVAFLYASVGHGGASGYLALMALFSFSPSLMKPSALLLNIFVSFISFFHYYRRGHFKWKLFLPFALISIPASFAGSFISIDDLLYKRILGILLILPILRFFGLTGRESNEEKEVNIGIALFAGGVIGLISGMIGIGGGIILSPLILIMHWGNMKQTAAISSLFIFVNSISGLIGLFSKGIAIDSNIYLWVIIAFSGGFLGAFLGSGKFSNTLLKRVLALVLVIACVKLMNS